MSKQSVFEGVLRHETAFTALLANLLRRSGELRAVLYEFLTKGKLPDVSSTEVTCESWEDANRHDIRMEFGGVPESLTIEVKVRCSCQTTASQKDGRGSYSGVHWLVPEDWLAGHPIKAPQDRIHTLESLARWLRRVLDPRTLEEDQVVSEFISYLELAFPTIRFTSEEARIMVQDPKDFASAAIKLHRIVDSVAERLREPLPGVQDYQLRSDPPRDDEYGYFVMQRSKKNGYILWFGIWPCEGCLLMMGYENKWHSGPKPAGFAPSGEGKWVISNMNDLVYLSDPVQTMHGKVLEAARLLS